MSNVIGVIDYGIAGNIYSIKKALEKAGAEVLVVQSSDQYEKVDKLVLPGVGSFKDAIKEIKERNLYDSLCNQMQSKPTLGICLGMQILAKIGYEYGREEGLALLDAEVKPILCQGSVPHMGFNDINVVADSPILKGIENEQFYFMHSFEMVNYTDVVSLTTYNNHQFVSSVAKDGIFGVQFHPEKSRDAGIQLFKNFISI